MWPLNLELHVIFDLRLTCDLWTYRTMFLMVVITYMWFFYYFGLFVLLRRWMCYFCLTVIKMKSTFPELSPLVLINQKLKWTDQSAQFSQVETNSPMKLKNVKLGWLKHEISVSCWYDLEFENHFNWNPSSQTVIWRKNILNNN